VTSPLIHRALCVHSWQFVDNYEYEFPSDFEDEEIDEENAFTEEDKERFGDLFVKSDGTRAGLLDSDEGEDSEV
jgi:U3 small nucleolar RNA-associated protein 14